MVRVGFIAINKIAIFFCFKKVGKYSEKFTLKKVNCPKC